MVFHQIQKAQIRMQAAKAKERMEAAKEPKLRTAMVHTFRSSFQMEQNLDHSCGVIFLFLLSVGPEACHKLDGE
jgi:hypothetical protein